MLNQYDTPQLSLISGFRRHIDEICTLLEYYAASSGNPLPTFQDNVSGPIFKGQEVYFLLGLLDS
jgi:hypothetical protein